MKPLYRETSDFVPTDDPKRARFTQAEVNAAAKPGAPQIAWFDDDPEPSWHPYVVHLIKLVGRTLSFKIVNPDQGAAAAETPECQVNLDNRDHVWIEFPSTLELSKPIQGTEYAFLFLSEKFAKSVPATSQVNTYSKWPRGSGSLLARVAAAIKRTLANIPATEPNAVAPEDRKLLEKFVNTHDENLM